MRHGIGYTLLDSPHQWEVVSDSGRRLEPEPGAPGVYRGYRTEDEAESAARRIARERGRKYVGEVR